MKNENEKPFARRLSEAFDRNFYQEHTDTVGAGDRFQKGRQRLFSLLLDHPYFIENVSELRKKYNLPKDGFQDGQEVYLWEHNDKENRQYFVGNVYDLLSDFKIPNVYKRSVWHFVYDYVIFPKRTEQSWIERSPLFSIIETAADREINKYLVNPNSTYIEVFEWTTGRDVTRALKKINKNKKIKLPFKVSKIGGISRMVWRLTQKGLADGEIKDEVNKFIKDYNEKRTFGYEDVPVYRKRYKNALSVLRKIK